MNKSKIKLIKNYAKKFPKSIEEFQEVEQISGKDLIKKGILQVNGEDIEPLKTFTAKTTKVREINHYRRLKKIYESGVTNPMKTYTEWFIIHHKKMIEKYPKLFKTKANEN